MKYKVYSQTVVDIIVTVEADDKDHACRIVDDKYNRSSIRENELIDTQKFDIYDIEEVK